jgi:hypothetical protein
MDRWSNRGGGVREEKGRRSGKRKVEERRSKSRNTVFGRVEK